MCFCTDGVETHCDPLTTTSGDDPGLSATDADENNDDISAAVAVVSLQVAGLAETSVTQ